MKNLNLFTWLLECSDNAAKIGLIPCQLRQQDGKNTAKTRQKDGKSSIYRRIITLLTLLLTLGVGQMWGATIFNCGIDVNGTWYKGTGTINSGHWLESKTAYSNHNFEAITSLELGGQYETWDNNQTDYCSWNGNNGIWITIKKSSTQIDNFKLSCYHKKKDGNNNVWETKGGTGGCSDFGSWGTYTVDISGYAAGNDYTIKASWTSPSAQYNEATAKFTINPVVTFKANGGTGSDYTQRVTYNTSTALTANTFTRTGYDFAGWATSADGNVVYAGGANVKLTAHTTLYAKWLPQSLTITSHPTYLTTTDHMTLGIDYANIPSGYCYRVKVGAGYYNNSSNQDRDAISGTGSATFTSYSGLPLGANTVVVELWKNSPFEKQSVVSDGVTVTVEQAYLVNVQAKTDGVESTTGGTVSPASVNASAHLGQTITASEPNTGYDFNGWTANTPNITFADPSALSTTVYATAGGWVYANYVRQSGSYSTTFYAGDHGSINAKGTAIAKNGSASVTIGENETLSATPESADYVFDHWGTTGSVSVANIYSATTTVTATAAGGTVTAYYRHRPTLGAVTATPSGTQNYAGAPIDFALSVTSTYMAHPVVVFLVNDGTTTYEVVGAPYGADGSSAAGTIGSDAANTTVHKATFTASAAKTYTVSAKLYEGELMDNFEGENTRGWAGDNLGDGSMTFANNPVKMTVNGSNKVMQVTRTGGADHGGAIMSFTAVGDRVTCDAAGSNDYAYIHARMKNATDATHLKNNDAAGNTDDINPTFDGATSSDWRHVTYHNTHCSNNFLFFMIQRGNTENKTVYIDDIILSNEETMTVKASEAATASFSINWNYTVTLNNNGATSAGTTSVDVTYGSALSNITVPTKTGYTFYGYYTEDAGAGTLQINASGVWQNAGYVSGGNWNSGSNQTLYAKWTENMTAVTIGVNPANSGTLTVDAAAFTPGNTTSAGVTTSHTVVATKQPGYKFSSWGTSGNATGTSSTNTYTLKGNGSGSTGTLTANFSRLYAYVQGRFQVKNAARNSNTTTYASGGQWNESSTNIQMEYDDTNHRFELHTHMTPSELTANHGTGCQDCKPYFFIKTSTSNSSLAGVTTYMCTSAQTLTTAGSANGKTVSSSSGSNTNLRFNSNTTTSYAVVYFDESKIWYELEQRLQYDANGGSGTAPTGDNGHNSYHAKDANATAEANTFTARKNYTFAGWNTAADITGTSYAAGASVPMSADRILYAKWNRSVTLDQQDATTPGSTSVTATWNCSTLPTINNPEKTGYEFGGWYTETAGNGNIIINTSGQLQANKTNWTVSGGKFQRTPSSDASESKPLYAKWTQTVTLNANLANHGSGDNTTATIVYKATAKTNITHCTPATGYHLEGYYTAATDGVKVLNADGSFASSAVTDYITDGKWTKAGATTLYAHYEPNTYDVILDVNGATSGSNQTVTATFDAAMPTVCSDGTTPLAAPSKTGYTFGGYWTNNTGTGTQYYTNALASNHIWDVATNNTHIYAKWTANPYTVTLDVDEANKGTTTYADESASVIFDAVPTTIANRPTAANGYALDGYYTNHNGEGEKVINGDGTWIASVAGYTDGDAKWVHDGDVTLYAYYKKAEITNLVAAPGVIAPGETITITPTIEPTPTGPTKVCYELQYSNGTTHPSQPSFYYDGNAVTFSVPSASATYIIQATLAKGSDCPANPADVLSTRTTTFQVAGAHDVTVKYMCGDLTIKASEVLEEIRPLTWSEDITAPTITGYTFARWDAGDGVTIKDGSGENKTTSTSSTIKIKAVYDGTLTAVYNKKNMIYFNNTLGWDDVWVYFYNNDKYWDNSYGTGAYKGKYWDGTHPYNEVEHGRMTQIEGTTIWYFDYTAAGYNTHRSVVAFANMDKSYSGTDDTSDNDKAFFSNTTANPIQVIRRTDHNAALPMFVPFTGQATNLKNNKKANYVSNGYWMNYPENTGYTLKIYNAWNVSKETGAVQSIAFPYSEDKTMPLKMDVELSDGYNHDYWFMIYRNDGVYLGGTYHFKQGSQAEQVITGGDNKEKITTSAPGDYTFTLTYHDNGSGTVNYYIDVDFPIATGDYRIYYSDNATWSKAAHTKDSWYHPSHSIGKATTEAKKDTISFYIPKGEGILHTMKFQKASVTNEGVVTWADVAGGGITIPSSVNATGVYNFIVSQPAGGASISLEKVEPYTGNFYIRTDCAGNTKWDSFKNVDHQMTYSDYAEKNSGYSHYYAHWVESGTNVKFTIANDYSMCISDTLIEDYGTTIANISNVGALNSGNASIRFMWNQATNKISRAYISGSSNISDRFLVLEGDAKMYDENGNVLTTAGGGKISGLNDYEMNLVDDQNFVYERTIQVNTGARAKLTAKYNNNIQYFKGSEGDFAVGTTVELLGGEASGKHTMRIVYDFKTNRLVTAYVPSGTIVEPIAINADLMIVREHQEEGQQLRFESEGALSEVHTVYGVMRFNRWTLNNKEKTGGHSPMGDPKSIYERSLYWISFPFDVNLGDVFGFGTYGVDWIIEYYDGAERATKGFWADSPGFWKMYTNRAGVKLEAGKGYVLAIDIDRMKDNNTDFWVNNIEQVELFFPSAANVKNISQTTAHTVAESHLCSIDRTNSGGTSTDINKNRTKADSHWNMIGVPSYANYGEALTSDGSSATITWNSNPYTNDLPFLYEWNMTDDSYTVQSGTTYPFKAMHSYMVQYSGNLYWSLASATPTSPIVARRTYAQAPQSTEFRLELRENEKMADQTFIRFSNDEEVSMNFNFNEDLFKEFNGGKANIYTLIENYIPAAGNILPTSEQTTVIPVGVKIVSAGEYTFSIPNGTGGVSVVLIDNITGTHTNLALADYTVTLGEGTLSDRFTLEVSPIQQMTTEIEETEFVNHESTSRKLLIDGILYIIKDGKVFDARGALIQ